MNLLEINSWFQYLRYIAKRNKGYSYRKILNSFNEISEIACYSWLFSESLLKDYLVIPLFFILFSFLLDQILFTARISANFNAKLIRKILLFAIACIGVAGHFYFNQLNSRDGFQFIYYIFYIKLAGITIQSMINLQIVEYYANRRIRPRFHFFILISVINIAIFFPLSYQFVGVFLFLAVAASFSVIKILFELIYYHDVTKTISAGRFTDKIFEKKSQKTLNSFGVLFILVSLLVISYEISLLQRYPFILTLFMLSFFYRIVSRSYRFLWIDFKRLGQNFTIKISLMRRSIFIIFLCVFLMILLTQSLISLLVGVSALFLCLIELNLLLKLKLGLGSHCVLVAILVLLLNTQSAEAFFAVTLVGIGYLLFSIRRFHPADNFFTNYSYCHNPFHVVSRFNFYGVGEDIRKILEFTSKLDLKLRRINKKTFIIIAPSSTFDFKEYEEDFIAQFGGIALLRTFEHKDFFKEFFSPLKLPKYYTKKNFFGFWNNIHDATLVRILNFHSYKLSFSFSHKCRFDHFKYKELQLKACDPLGRKWYRK